MHLIFIMKWCAVLHHIHCLLNCLLTVFNSFKQVQMAIDNLFWML